MELTHHQHWQTSPFMSQGIFQKILPDMFEIDHTVFTSLGFATE
jgi:hypothetical protein